MTASAPVPQNHPLMIAWTAYKDTPEYANTANWAVKPSYTEGSLWAAFVEGWNAGAGLPPQSYTSDQGVRAHLIAAAPDLYAALEAMLHARVVRDGAVIDRATAALAKARGEAGAQAPSHGQRGTGAATLRSNEAAQPNSNPEGFQ